MSSNVLKAIIGFLAMILVSVGAYWLNDLNERLYRLERWQQKSGLEIEARLVRIEEKLDGVNTSLSEARDAKSGK